MLDTSAEVLAGFKLKFEFWVYRSLELGVYKGLGFRFVTARVSAQSGFRA